MGVFLAYASPKGRTFIDRELYLPKEWSEDPPRCEEAGVPQERTFATKPQLALEMLKRTRAAGVVTPWVTGDEVYGSDDPLRQWLEANQQAYVLAFSPGLSGMSNREVSQALHGTKKEVRSRPGFELMQQLFWW